MILLDKSPERDFLILNLTDIQLSDSEWAEGSNCRFLLRTLHELVERVHPDLITLSGDQGWAGQDASYDKLADLLDATGIPWAPVWGNHDNQGGPAPVDAVADRYLTHPLCRYEKGDPALGNGNYVIAIREGKRVVSALIMMDTHDLLPPPEGGAPCHWAKLSAAQLDWYREQVALLKGMGCHDTAIIMHIPCYAYREAAEAAFRPEVDRRAVTVAEAEGGDIWNPGYEDSIGVQYEDICCYPFGDDVLPALLEAGTTKHVLVGHDHIDNFMITYKGIRLIYGLKTGCGCYWDPRLNGGTTLRITSEGIAEAKHEYVDVTDLL